MKTINTTIGSDALKRLIVQQVNTNFLLSDTEELDLLSSLNAALEKSAFCFSAINNKYYRDNDNTVQFNPYHSGQYTIFLYHLSRELWLQGHDSLADRVYYLNKMLNSIDLFYQVELPNIFFLDHPNGSVLGRAKYSDYFTFQQNCTIGGNHGVYPQLGEHVRLFAGATVIGKSTLGNNVFVSAASYIKDTDIPDNTIVFGASPNLILKPKPKEYFLKMSVFLDHRSTL